MLTRKLLRDIRRDAGLLIAVAVVIGLGVLLFVGSAAGYLDLSTSYARVQDDLGLADLHVDADVGDADVATIGALPGVAAIDRRTLRSAPIAIGGHALEARVISLPDAGQPVLDRLILVEGALPSPGEVLAELHLAEFHHLHAGDTVNVDVGSTKRPMRVSGVAVSAEYLWVSRDATDPMPTPADFGVLWMRDADVHALGATAQEQLLVRTRPGADRAVSTAIRATLGDRATAITPRKELVGLRLLQMDVDGLRGMALFFPVFFLGVAAFVFAAVLARIVDGQRAIVGTMLALGVPRARVLRHYLAFAAIVGGIGSTLGVVGGIGMGRALVSEYAAELHIPSVVTEVRPGLWLAGLIIGLLVSLVAAWGPARRAANLAPADAMRPAAPNAGPLLAWSRHLGFLPLSARFALRSIARRPVRSLGTSFGVAAALVLVITTSGLMESIAVAIRVQAQDAWAYDDRADLVAPMLAGELADRARAIDGVTDVEVAMQAPVRITAKSGFKEVIAQGLAPGARLLRSVDFDGHEQMPGDGRIVLPGALGRALGVTIGDAVDVKVLPDGTSQRFVVDGFAEAAIGGAAVLRLDDLSAATALPGLANVVVVRTRPGQAAAVRERLFDVPGVVRVSDIGSLRAMIDDFTGLVWAFVGMMLAASVVLAAAVLYDTASLSILERQRELATLRALGRPMRAIAATITLEHAGLAIGGLVLGWPLSAIALHHVLDLYNSDLFSMPYVLTARTIGVAGLGVALVLLVAQWPALRQVARTNLAEAVRARD